MIHKLQSQSHRVNSPKTTERLSTKLYFTVHWSKEYRWKYIAPDTSSPHRKEWNVYTTLSSLDLQIQAIVSHIRVRITILQWMMVNKYWDTITSFGTSSCGRHSILETLFTKLQYSLGQWSLFFNDKEEHYNKLKVVTVENILETSGNSLPLLALIGEVSWGTLWFKVVPIISIILT